MTPRQRLWASLAVVPLAFFPVTLVTVIRSIPSEDWGEIAWFALISTYGFTLVIWLPWLLLAWSFNFFRRNPMMTIGALLGWLVIQGVNPDLPWVVAPLSGLLSGFLLWRITSGPSVPQFAKGRNRNMLTVLYDGRCALCRRAQAWLESQPKFVPLEYVAAGSQEARRRFPGLDHDNTLVDLTVVSFNGEVYHGAKAWIMCLWALKKYRGTALRLATPELMPTAKRVIAWVSRNRFNIGQDPAWKT